MSQTKAELIKGLNINASAPATALQIDASGNVNIDSNTLYVDATNNRVGIGTSSPSYLFHVENASANTDAFVGQSSTRGLFWQWRYNATPSSAYGEISTYGSANDLRIQTQGGGGNTILNPASGRVGIGTTSPGKPLDVRVAGSANVGSFSNGTQGIDLATTASGGSIQAYDQNQTLDLKTFGTTTNSINFIVGSTERARIDSSGRLLVGTSSARSNFFNTSAYAPYLQLEGASSVGQTMMSITSGDLSLPGYLLLSRQKSGTIGGNTAVSVNDGLGYIAFQGSDGTEFVAGAYIFAEVDGTPGANDLPTRLIFSTTADGSSNPTERMRITQAGELLLGTGSLNASLRNRLNVDSGSGTYIAGSFKNNSGSGAQTLETWNASTTGDAKFISFITETTVIERGLIDFNRSAGQVRYNVTSDRRLKANIQSAGTALNDLSGIQVRSYKWAETGYQVDYGFIAQELNEVAPDAVKVGDDGEEVTDTWAVDNGKLVPLLTKALQEAIAKIETLEARLTAAGID